MVLNHMGYCCCCCCCCQFDRKSLSFFSSFRSYSFSRLSCGSFSTLILCIHCAHKRLCVDVFTQTHVCEPVESFASKFSVVLKAHTLRLFILHFFSSSFFCSTTCSLALFLFFCVFGLSSSHIVALAIVPCMYTLLGYLNSLRQLNITSR